MCDLIQKLIRPHFTEIGFPCWGFAVIECYHLFHCLTHFSFPCFFSDGLVIYLTTIFMSDLHVIALHCIVPSHKDESRKTIVLNNHHSFKETKEVSLQRVQILHDRPAKET